MAGAKIQLEYDATTATAALDYVGGKLDSEGRQLLLSHVGEYMFGSTRDRGARQVDPSGQRWRALEPTYARWKRKVRPGVPILKFDYHMLGDQLSWQLIGDTAVEIGTNAIYGARHQFGSSDPHRPMPARPWLGASEEDDNEIVVITRSHLIGGMPGS
jgi:phage virion morphogenesis protein